MVFFEVLLAIMVIVIAGTLNMVFVKLPVLNFLKKPMDFGACMSDGKRIFGDNKTWKGFIGMCFWTAVIFALFTALAKTSDGFNQWAWFPYRTYTPPQSLLYGALWGLGYVAFELPNSFIKRRLDVKPGKRAHGAWKGFFIFVDQADSAVGCCAAVYLFHNPPFFDIVLLFFLGVGIHFMMNVILYLLGLKRELL